VETTADEAVGYRKKGTFGKSEIVLKRETPPIFPVQKKRKRKLVREGKGLLRQGLEQKRKGGRSTLSLGNKTRGEQLSPDAKLTGRDGE